jgi:hypothetical protein
MRVTKEQSELISVAQSLVQSRISGDASRPMLVRMIGRACDDARCLLGSRRTDALVAELELLRRYSDHRRTSSAGSCLQRIEMTISDPALPRNQNRVAPHPFLPRLHARAKSGAIAPRSSRMGWARGEPWRGKHIKSIGRFGNSGDFQCLKCLLVTFENATSKHRNARVRHTQYPIPNFAETSST